MWIRVISLRSKTARLGYLMAVLAVLLGLVPRNHAKAAPHLIPVYRVATRQKAMSLTINVVWGTQYVAKLLAVLRAQHVAATFMVGGAWAQAHPDLVRAMRADGMEVGNHGWAHGHPNQMSLAANINDIDKTNQAVKAILGVRPEVYAPPYGEFNATVLKAADALHMPLIMWTIDTIDWRPSSSPEYMTAKVLNRARPGAIVLMHPTDRTVVALPAIVRGLKASGYRLVTVSQLLTMGTPQADG